MSEKKSEKEREREKKSEKEGEIKKKSEFWSINVAKGQQYIKRNVL